MNDFDYFKKEYYRLADTIYPKEEFEQHIHDAYVRYKNDIMKGHYMWDSPAEFIQVTLGECSPQEHCVYLKERD